MLTLTPTVTMVGLNVDLKSLVWKRNYINVIWQFLIETPNTLSLNHRYQPILIIHEIRLQSTHLILMNFFQCIVLSYEDTLVFSLSIFRNSKYLVN